MRFLNNEYSHKIFLLSYSLTHYVSTPSLVLSISISTIWRCLNERFSTAKKKTPSRSITISREKKARKNKDEKKKILEEFCDIGRKKNMESIKKGERIEIVFLKAHEGLFICLFIMIIIMIVYEGTWHMHKHKHT